MRKFILPLLVALLFLCTAAAEDTTEVQMGVAIAAWQCEVCAAENTGNFCGSCGAEKNVWLCGECAQENNTEYCTYCGTKKPGQEVLITANYGTTEQTDYRVIGYFSLPEGYTRDEKWTGLDMGAQSLLCRNDRKDAPVRLFYALGKAKEDAEHALQDQMDLLNEGVYIQVKEPASMQIDGHTAYYAYFVSLEYDQTGLTPAMYFFIEAGQGGCIQVTVTGRTVLYETLPTPGELLAEAEKILALLEIEE